MASENYLPDVEFTDEGDTTPAPGNVQSSTASNGILVVSKGTSDTLINNADPEKHQTELDKLPPRDISGWKWALVVTAILSSIFLYALDATIVADIQPAIVAEFDGLEKLTWISVAFLLGASATNLLWGKIYSQMNAKWTYVFCVAAFEVGSAICGVSVPYCQLYSPVFHIFLPPGDKSIQ